MSKVNKTNRVHLSKYICHQCGNTFQHKKNMVRHLSTVKSCEIYKSDSLLDEILFKQFNVIELLLNDDSPNLKNIVKQVKNHLFTCRRILNNQTSQYPEEKIKQLNEFIDEYYEDFKNKSFKLNSENLI